MGAPRKTGQSDDGVAAIRADRYAHWRAELNRELFFETEPRQLASSGLPTAPSLTSAQSPAPLPALGSDAELQAALDRCAPLFAPSADLFAGASDASEKYLRASRALGVKPNPRIAAAFKTSVPAGPDRVAVVAEALDEGTLGALLCALGATPSVTRLKLWHNALSPIGWAMLARLLPGTAISVLECSAQDAAAAVRPYGSWGGGADGAVNGEVQHDVRSAAAHPGPLGSQTEPEAVAALAHSASADGAAAAAGASAPRDTREAGARAETAPHAPARGAWLRAEDRVGALLACAPGLAALSARHCALHGAPAMLSLAPCLARHASLLALDLSGNPLGDAGVSALARALASNRSVEALALSAVQAGDGGALAMASLLAARRRARSDEVIAYRQALAAGLAQLAPVEAADESFAQGATAVGKGAPAAKPATTPTPAAPKPPLPGSKERRPVLTASMPQREAATGVEPYAGLNLVAVLPDAAAAAAAAAQGASADVPVTSYWACGNSALRWVSLAHNHISHAGKQALFEAASTNAVCQALELDGNPCARGFGASLPFVDVVLLHAAWRAVRRRRAGSAPSAAVVAGVGTAKGGAAAHAAGKKASGHSTPRKEATQMPSAAEPQRAHDETAPSALAVALLEHLFAARPLLLGTGPQVSAAVKLASPPFVLATAAAIDRLISAVLESLPAAPDQARDALLAAALKLGLRGVWATDDADVAAVGDALRQSWADELEILGAASLALLPGAEPIGAAAAGIAQGATVQARILGAVSALWAEAVCAAPLPPVAATPGAVEAPAAAEL